MKRTWYRNWYTSHSLLQIAVQKFSVLLDAVQDLTSERQPLIYLMSYNYQVPVAVWQFELLSYKGIFLKNLISKIQ